MSKIDLQNITVLNYNENDVFVDSSKEHYKFNASRDGINPTMQDIPISELQYICSNTDIFVTGWLTFNEDEKEEIFTALRVPNWRDILTNEDIREILTNPTMEGLQRILDITSITYFDRVRIVMFKLLSEGIDISSKVKNVVDRRYDELQKRQRITSIVLNPRVEEKKVSNEQVKELSEQNVKLQEQIEQMKQMMEKLMASQASDSAGDSNTTKVDAEAPKKKAGRPPKKSS
jgi:hypothetical protein|nr:MAG TPA: hypothetical protein [Caudoviricetes sp.]